MLLIFQKVINILKVLGHLALSFSSSHPSLITLVKKIILMTSVSLDERQEYKAVFLEKACVFVTVPDDKSSQASGLGMRR